MCNKLQHTHSVQTKGSIFSRSDSNHPICIMKNKSASRMYINGFPTYLIFSFLSTSHSPESVTTSGVPSNNSCFLFFILYVECFEFWFKIKHPILGIKLWSWMLICGNTSAEKGTVCYYNWAWWNWLLLVLISHAIFDVHILSISKSPAVLCPSILLVATRYYKQATRHDKKGNL